MTGHYPGGTGTPKPDTTVAVAGLAREVEALRQRVSALGHVGDQLDELAKVVTELGERLAATKPTLPAGPGSWLRFPEQVTEDAAYDTAVAVLGDLAAWVGTVYLRYGDGAATLPECWLWHPDVVEELLWLRHSWAAAYTAPTASAALAGDWHDRGRPGVVRRIRAAAGACSIEAHHADGEHHRPAPATPLVQASDVIADWWVRARRLAPPDAASVHGTTSGTPSDEWATR